MKTDLLTQFNLPSYTKGKSFAQASKDIEAKFKGRNDKASIETKQELLERLSQAQEYLKQQNESINPNNTFNDGGLIQGVNELNPNGVTNLTTNSNIQGISGPLNLGGQQGDTGDTGEGPGVGAYIGAAQGALELGNMAFGKSGIDTTGATKAPEVKVGNSIASGTLKGAQTGMAFGPLGAGIGAGVGAIAGLIGGGKAKKDAIEASKNYDWAQNSKHVTTFDLGGYTDPNNDKDKLRNLTSEEKAKLEAEIRAKGANAVFSPDAAGNYQGGIFQTKDSVSNNYPNLDLGKYKDVNYFNPSVSQDGRYTLNNTKNNPANADLYKQQLSYIKKLNPSANIAMYNDSGFKPLINQQAMGGYQNKYDGLTRRSSFINNDPTITQNPEGINIDANKLGLNPAGFEAYQAANAGNTYVEPKTQAGEVLNKTGDFLKDNYGSILRYAPIVGNLTDKLKKPNTERGTRLDNVYQPQLFDEQSLLNQINQNNVNRAVTESSGGDLGALRTNLLASNLNKTKAISDAYMKGEQVNRDEKRFQFQNALQKDTFNAQQDERYIERKAQDEGAYNTAKSSKRAALFEDIGKIGKEETYKKMVKDMFNYSWDGKYFVNNKGDKLTKEEMDNKIKNKK